MNAGDQGQSEYCGVDRWQVVPRTHADLGSKNHDRDCDNLDYGADLAGQGRLETSESRDDIDGSGTDQNEDIAADYRDGHPKR